MGLPSPPLCHGVNLRWWHPGLHHQTRFRGWVKPSLPGNCGVGFGPSFWGDRSVPRGVSFISSILPWQRERRAAGGKKKKEAKCRVPLLPSRSSRGAECQLSAGNCQGLTGAQPSAAEHEITSTGQEKGWLCTEGPGFSPQRGAKVK